MAAETVDPSDREDSSPPSHQARRTEVAYAARTYSASVIHKEEV